MSNTFEIYKRGKFQDIAIVNEHPKTSVPAWSWSSSTHARNGSQPCKRPRSRILDSREIRGRFWLDGPRTHRMASAYNWPLDHSIDSLRRDILFYLIIIFFFFRVWSSNEWFWNPFLRHSSVRHTVETVFSFRLLCKDEWFTWCEGKLDNFSYENFENFHLRNSCTKI